MLQLIQQVVQQRLLASLLRKALKAVYDEDYLLPSNAQSKLPHPLKAVDDEDHLLPSNARSESSLSAKQAAECNTAF
eukprot:410594-Pelagomonas_calceolata.AAC.1